MSTSIWDGDTLPDYIAQHLIEGGFPFGIGVPFRARTAMCEFLCDAEFANEVATAASVDLTTAVEVLSMAAQLIEEAGA